MNLINKKSIDHKKKFKNLNEEPKTYLEIFKNKTLYRLTFQDFPVYIATE